MRIGIVPTLNSFTGGIYQYSLTMLRALDEWRKKGSFDAFTVFAEDTEHAFLSSLKPPAWTVKPLQPLPSEHQVLDALRRIVGEGPHREAWRLLRHHWSPQNNHSNPSRDQIDFDTINYKHDMRAWFEQADVELMLYPAPNRLSFEAQVPYIMAIHDLQHRLQPEFPEVSSNGVWEGREYTFRNATRTATLLLADSEAGKEDILNFYSDYGIEEDRIKVLPFLPAHYLAVEITEQQRTQVRAKYQLPERYLFYPAQFWPHKNHARIVQALGLIKKEHRHEAVIVFCGSHNDEIRQQTFKEVLAISQEMGLEKQLHFLGYVPDDDMSALYSGAIALVMPTFFSPTNIPVLEAWAFSCPVLTSNIRGIREQAGNAAILADPRSVEEIADGMYRLWTDESLCRMLAELGRQRLASYTPYHYRTRLIDIVEEAKARVRSKKVVHA